MAFLLYNSRDVDDGCNIPRRGSGATTASANHSISVPCQISRLKTLSNLGQNYLFLAGVKTNRAASRIPIKENISTNHHLKIP